MLCDTQLGMWSESWRAKLILLLKDTRRCGVLGSPEGDGREAQHSWHITLDQVNGPGLLTVVGSTMWKILLFVAEHVADHELSSIFQAKGKGVEKVKKENLSWICDDEDVQFMWCMLSPTSIESEEVCQHLLWEIAHLWITTRGQSKAKKIKEDYKRAKAKGTKREHSLRKELAKTKVVADNNWFILIIIMDLYITQTASLCRGVSVVDSSGQQCVFSTAPILFVHYHHVHLPVFSEHE